MLRPARGLALALLATLGCGTAAPQFRRPRVPEPREDPVALERSVAAAAAENRQRAAQERADGEEERDALAQALDAAVGDYAGLPSAVRDALAHVDPLVLVGLAPADWARRSETFMRLLTGAFPPGFGSAPGERAYLAAELFQQELLVRDHEWAQALEVQGYLQQCVSARAGWPRCVFFLRDEWRRRRSDESRVSSLARRIVAPPSADRVPRVRLLLAWAQPVEQRAAALDAIASQRDPVDLRREALLLAARDHVGRGDAVGATLLIRRARLLRTPTSAPDPALELLSGVALLLANGDLTEARRAFELARAERPAGPISEEATRLLATLAP